MIIAYGRYPILDPSVRDEYADSSERFRATGFATPGNAGFYFFDDLFDRDLVHMIHRWDTEADFAVFRKTEGHDVRIAETDAFGEAKRVVRADLVFFRENEEGDEGTEVCSHLTYDADPADVGFLDSCRRFQEDGLAAPGNAGWAFGRDWHEPTTVHLWHLWESRDAFDAFMASPEHQRRRAEVDAMEAAGTVKRVQRHILDGLVTRRIAR